MGVSFAKVITEARPGFDAVTVKRCRLEGDEDLWSVEVPTGARLFVANRSQLVWVDDGARDEEPAVVVYRDGGIVATYPRSALAEYDVVGRFDARVVWGRGEEALRVQADGSPDAYLVDFEGHGLWPDR